MYAKFCIYFYVKKKRSELKSDSELQQSAEHNRKDVSVGWRKSLDMELHELHRLIHISDKLKGNNDDRDGNNTQHEREEKGINLGSLSHDNAPPQIGARKSITRRIQVRNFRAFYVQYRLSTK